VDNHVAGILAPFGDHRRELHRPAVHQQLDRFGGEHSAASRFLSLMLDLIRFRFIEIGLNLD
jgi:hypothetical protein